MGRVSRRVQIPGRPTSARATAQTIYRDVVLSKSGRRERGHTVQFCLQEVQRRTKPNSTARCQVGGCQRQVGNDWKECKGAS